MKRFAFIVALLLTLTLAFPMSGCSGEGEKSSVNIVESASALISEGKFTEAYSMLCSAEQTDEVKAMLNGFYLSFEKVSVTENGKNLNYEYKYTRDNLGRKSYVVADDPDMDYESEYIYDESGKLIRQTDYMMVSHKKEAVWKYNYTYVGNKLCGTTIYCRGNLHESVAYSYNAEGNLECEQHSDSNNKFSYEKIYYYENGKAVKVTVGNGVSISSVYEYKYDNSGELIEETATSYDEEGAIKSIKVKTYNVSAERKSIKEVFYNSDGTEISNRTTEYTVPFVFYDTADNGDLVK